MNKNLKHFMINTAIVTGGLAVAATEKLGVDYMVQDASKAKKELACVGSDIFGLAVAIGIVETLSGRSKKRNQTQPS